MSSRALLVILSLLSIVSFQSGDTYSADGQNPQTLRLLVLVPFPDPRPSAGWDRGLELLPAARLARDHVNSNTDILPGYHLELIEASSDACTVPAVSKAFVSFTQHATSKDDLKSVLGVLGLACSTVTANISPLAGRSELDYIQVSMSNSPLFRSREEYPHLWRVLPSSLAYAATAINVVIRFNWTRVATVYDGSGVFFYSTALSFIELVKQSGKMSPLVSPIQGTSELYITGVLDSIRSKGLRIIFLSVSEAQSSAILCKAAQLGLVWPGYVWIISARSTIKEFLLDVPCPVEQLLFALENAILFSFELAQSNPQTKLVSGITYEEYHRQYLTQLELLQEEERFSQYNNSIATNENHTLFANPMYDEVFSLALALNQSLPLLNELNISLQDDLATNRTAITEAIETQFTRIAFQGATGFISFDENREGLSPIVLYQVRNSSVVTIGEYDSVTNHLTLTNINASSVPDDQIETKFKRIAQPISVFVFTASGLTVIYTSVVLFFVLLCSQSKVIKAISPILSVVIFIGCYMESLAAILRTIVYAFSIPTVAYQVVCCLEIWLGSTGLNLVLSTVLLKLARIYRIFTYFGKTGKIWSDVSLLFMVLSINFPVNLYLAIWFAVETPMQKRAMITRTDVVPPFIEVTNRCYSENFQVLLIILFIPSIILLFIVIIFALLTRKINRANFKDTKKITAYVVLIFVTIVFALPAWKLLEVANLEDFAHLALTMGFVCVALLTVSFLFLPKIITILYASYQKKRTYILTGKLRNKESIKF